MPNFFAVALDFPFLLYYSKIVGMGAIFVLP